MWPKIGNYFSPFPAHCEVTHLMMPLLMTLIFLSKVMYFVWVHVTKESLKKKLRKSGKVGEIKIQDEFPSSLRLRKKRNNVIFVSSLSNVTEYFLRTFFWRCEALKNGEIVMKWLFSFFFTPWNLLLRTLLHILTVMQPKLSPLL